jgi:hypothetical protein
MAESFYYKLDEKNIKIFYRNSVLIGSEYEMIKYFISKGISSSKAHKLIVKIKELKE